MNNEPAWPLGYFGCILCFLSGFFARALGNYEWEQIHLKIPPPRPSEMAVLGVMIAVLAVVGVTFAVMGFHGEEPPK